MSKISTYFYIQEFVPEEIYTRFGEKSIWFVDKRIILLADFIRNRFKKPMTVNNWHNGGTFNYRGFRPRSYEIGGELSQHRFGRGIDFNIESITSEEIYNDIKSNNDIYLKAGATTIEDISFTPTWNHIDNRQNMSDIDDKILIVKP